jgi:aspartyl-tRNA(Asn)/glutamyl-tRNA(Gln) amidotransferase subunit A
MALAALGSDTGGSIRQPSAFCGLFGLKPTYGAVSRYGLMAAASSFDQIGPMAKSVEDVEILFNAIKGRDAFDSTSINLETRRSLEKIRIGVPYHFMKDGIDGDVRSNFDETILMLKKAGCEIKEITLPHISYSLATYYVIIFAEESSNLSRFDGVKYGLRVESDSLLKEYLGTRTAGFGREVRRRIMLGNYILSSGYYDAYYNKANAVRELLRTDFSKTFNDVDVVLTPTSPVPAFKIGEKSGDPLSMYLADIFTVTANLVGNPAISVPSGVTEREGKKLPLGVQFMSSHGREDILFNVARKFPGA